MIINDGYLILLFDIPTLTSDDKKVYTRFHKGIIKLGFLMYQKSIYIKYIRELKMVSYEINKLNDIAPNVGDVRVIKLTKRQFDSIIIICGVEYKDTFSADFIEY